MDKANIVYKLKETVQKSQPKRKVLARGNGIKITFRT